MNKSLKRFLLLFALICVFVCGVVFAVACNPSEGGNEGTEVTYSVTVTAESDGLDLTTVKAQWMNGEEEASEAIALTADGKASVKLAAGNYTVVLSGYDTAKYESAPASVSADNPNATINITTVKYNVTVMVTVPEGVQLPADAAVQLYDGATEVGEAVALANNMATLKVPVGSNCTAGLVNIPDYLDWGEPKAVSESAKTLAFTIDYAEIEYKITVNVEGDTDGAVANTLKVTFYKGSEAVEGATALPVVGGTVTATLKAGEYTVKIDNLPETYEYTEGSVDITTREITLEATEIIYTVKLPETLPANVLSEAISRLKAQLYAAGEPYGEEVAFADGVAKINAPAGDYTVVFSGAEGYDAICGSLSATSREVTAYVGVVPQGGTSYYLDANNTHHSGSAYSVSAVGSYIITGKSAASSSYDIRVTGNVGGDGELLYTVTWNTLGSDSVALYAYNENADIITAVEGEVSAVLANGEDQTFALTLTSETNTKYVLNVATAPAPEKGSMYNPIDVDDVVGVYALPEGVEATEAYFRLPTQTSEGTYIVTVPEGVEVYWLNTSLVANPGETYSVVSGQQISPDIYSYEEKIKTSHTYFYAKLAENAAADTELTFEVTKAIAPGTSPVNPHALTLDTEVDHIFETSEEGLDAWFTFTPGEDGDYRIFDLNNSELVYDNGELESWRHAYAVYAGYELNEDGVTATGKDKVDQNVNGSITLTVGTEYYVYVKFIQNTSIKIKISKYVAQPGEKENPIEVFNTGDVLNEVTLLSSAGDDTYFKFVVTEDAINEDGDVTFSFAVTVSSMKVAFYGDADYSNQIGSAGVSEGTGAPEMITVARLSDLGVDDVVYFKINGYGTNVSFYINPVDTSKMLTLDTPLEVSIAGAQYSELTVEVPLNNVPAGDYKLTIITDGEPIQGAPFDVKIDNVTVFSNLFLNTSVNSTQEFTLQSAGTTLTITTVQFLASGSISVTLLLEDANFKLALDTPLSVEFDGTEYNAVSLEIPLDAGIEAGEYVLNIQVGTTSNGAPFEIIVDGGGTGENQIFDNLLAGDHNIVLTAQSTKITIYTSGFMNNSPIAMTLTLKKAAPKLTLDNSLEVDITGSSATVALDVPAGTYQLAYDFGMSVFMANIVAHVGDNEYTISTSAISAEQTGTVDITVAEGVQEMSLTINYNGGATTLTLSLTQLAVSYKYVAELDTGLAVEGVGFGQSNGVLIGLGESIVPGDYELRISTQLDGYGIYVNGEEISAVNGVVSFTVTADTKEFALYHFTFGTTIMTTVTITKAQSSEPTEGDIVVGEETPITDVGESFADKTVYLTAGTYTLTLSGADAGDIQVNNFSDDNNTVIAQGALTGTLTVTEDGMITLRFLNALWDNQAKTFSILITASGAGPVVPQEGDIVVGEEATFTIPTDNDQLISKTVYLEADTYTITLTYSTGAITVSEESFRLGYEGSIIGSEDPDSIAKTTTFTVTEAGLYTFTFQDMNYDGGMEITVLIEEGGSSGPVGPQEPTVDVNEEELVIGEELTVTIVAGHTLQINLASAPQEGFYRITLSGAAVGNGGEYTVYSIIFGELDTNGDVLTAMNNYSSEWLSFGGSEEFIQINCTGLTDVTITITIELLEA